MPWSSKYDHYGVLGAYFTFSKDWLSITDGNGDPVAGLGRYCGKKIPPNYPKTVCNSNNTFLLLTKTV